MFLVFSVDGKFDVVLIGEQEIDFYDIRHIQIHNFTKWSEEHIPEENPFEEEPEHCETIDEFVDEYFDDEWIRIIRNVKVLLLNHERVRAFCM